MYRQVIIAACTLTTIGMLAVLRPGPVEAQKKVTEITDVNRPGGQPYHGSVQIQIPAGSNGTNAFAAEAIPADKRLVVEYVSARVTVPLGQRGFIEVNDLVGGGAFGYTIPLTVEETTAQYQTSAASQLVRVYVEGFGYGAGASCRRDVAVGVAYCNMNVSGYLIDK